MGVWIAFYNERAGFETTWVRLYHDYESPLCAQVGGPARPGRADTWVRPYQVIVSLPFNTRMLNH